MAVYRVRSAGAIAGEVAGGPARAFQGFRLRQELVHLPPERIGARDGDSLRHCIRNAIIWSLVVATVFVGIYLVWWRDLLHLFTLNNPASSAQIIETAGQYIGWIIAIPIASSLPFLMDGIMVGATRTRIMRDSMILSTVVYFGVFFAFTPLVGNNALWCAFLLYMLLRGVLQYLMTHRLHDIYRQIETE